MIKTPIYVISDIHGALTKLLEVQERITQDAATHGIRDYTIIHIGDLVDRREDSKGVIEHLMAGIAAGKPWVVLKGNHDRMMHWFMEDPDRPDSHLKPGYSWLYHRIGGRETLESYGVTFAEEFDKHDVHKLALPAIPPAHLAFLRDLPSYIETDKYIFVHAGIRPNVAMDQQTEDDLVWIRGPFFEHTQSFGKVVIHGHTVIDQVTDYGNRINIDTGAAWGGPISVVFADDTGVVELDADGARVAITKAEDVVSS
ncbi:MAG: metallophosphoesterase [Amylibacter sp.]|nr:metallophosphoesterase [Amylibacter sp.]